MTSKAIIRAMIKVVSQVDTVHLHHPRRRRHLRAMEDPTTKFT